jgi:hypothetical protein
MTDVLPNLFRVADHPGYHSTGIPWKMIAPHEQQTQRNHRQSLRRLHERGGLSWCEALAVLQDRQWRAEPNAKAIVLAMVAEWDQEQMNASCGR